MLSRQPLVMQKCPSKLWEGVECDLPEGHKGPHHRAACAEGAALSWRSSQLMRAVTAPPEPVPQPAMFRLATLAR
jgi:hypothetical protein